MSPWSQSQWPLPSTKTRLEDGTTGNYQAYAAAWSGVQVYRGHAYPESYRGSIFAGANTSNLLHRRLLKPDGVTFKSVRADGENVEFVRSSDNWFRPVNSVNAPDGTLYVLDMCRELIEHGHVPKRVVKHLDFMRGSDWGRIYRVAPPDFKVPPVPRLSEANVQELVAHLEHPGGWWRETAHRLIYERQEASATPLLRRLLRESSQPLARMHALWSLKGLKALRDEDVALGESRDRRVINSLVRIAKTDSGDRWIRNSVLSSSTEFADRLFSRLVELEGFAEMPLSGDWLAPLARVVGGRGFDSELNRLTLAVATHSSLADRKEAQLAIVTSLAEGLGMNEKTLADLRGIPASATLMIQGLLDRSRSVAIDAGVPETACRRSVCSTTTISSGSKNP